MTDIEEVKRAFHNNEITFSQAVERLVSIGIGLEDAKQRVVSWAIGGE